MYQVCIQDFCSGGATEVVSIRSC